MIGRIWLGSLFLFAGALAFSQSPTPRTARVYYEPETEPPERQVDMLHMRLAVSFTPEKGVVRGIVTHRFTPLRQRVDSLFLHGPGIRVSQASCDGKSIPFDTTPDGIVLRFRPPLSWGATDSVTLTYEATPRRGIYFVGWNDSTRRSRRQIWTQGQGIDNRHWFPCYDEQNDKLTTEIFVTVPQGLQVLSNGSRLKTRKNRDGSLTWRYRMAHPHSSYLVMLGIGNYGIARRTSRSGVPIECWHYPDLPDRVEPTYRHMGAMVDFMENETGLRYPWESYAQIPVQDFLYGGMENTTATVFTDAYLVDRRGEIDNPYLYVNMHELAHQWFGDYVTGRSGVSSWLHESFATFYTKAFMETIAGDDEVQWMRRKEHLAALAASRADRYPILHSRAGRDRVYSKGSAVLDLARHLWGKEAFRRVINHYLRAHPYGSVETRDLINAFQDVLGISPGWFFDEWISRGGEPHYRIGTRDTAAGTSAHATVVSVEQTHARDELVGLFTLPVWFQVWYADGSCDSLRQTIGSAVEQVVVPNPRGKEVAFVLFDPGSYLPKEVAFPRTFETLRAQGLRAPLMIDRYDAIAAMREIPAAQKRAFLAERFGAESHYSIRAEIAIQLAGDPESEPTLRAALSDRSVHVRRAALEALPLIPGGLVRDVEARLRDSSCAVTAGALRMITAQFPEKRPFALDATRGVAGVGNQLRVLWHEINAEGGNLSSIDSLVDMAGVSFEFRTRVNALEALRRLDRSPPSLIPGLCDAVTHWNGRLRDPASEVFRAFLKKEGVRKGIEEYVGTQAWTPRQSGLLEGLLK